MLTSKSYGMKTMDQAMQELMEQGMVSPAFLEENMRPVPAQVINNTACGSNDRPGTGSRDGEVSFHSGSFELFGDRRQWGINKQRAHRYRCMIED